MLLAIIVAATAALAPIQGHAPLPPAGNRPPTRELIAWTIGDIRCGGEAVTMTHAVQPMVAQTYLNQTAIVLPLSMSFTIDPTGRALDIARIGTGYAPETGDIAPSLAASIFAPGTPRSDCRIIYLPRHMPLGIAPLADVRAFSVTPNVRPDREVFRRTFPATGDCFDPGPEVRLRGFPLFNTLPPTPARIAWSMTQFDIDAKGRPIHLQTIDGTGDIALDIASRKAIAESRFEPGARYGCVYPYYQNPATLPEPTPPEAATFRPAGANCPADSDWATKPNLYFPAAWNRRKIEGWAIVGFDVAPWGATGNVHVLAAQPSAEFGQAAENVIRAATKQKSATGYTGCVERVRYRISPRGEPQPDGSTSAIPPLIVD